MRDYVKGCIFSAVFLLSLSNVAPVEAHDPTEWYIIHWTVTSQTYKFTANYPSNTTYPGFRTRINDANAQWRNLAGRMSFTLGSGSDYAAYNPYSCPQTRNGIHYYSISGTAAGVAPYCATHTPSDSIMNTAQMVIDGSPTYPWYYGTGTPANTHLDLYSAAAHEWGHMYSRVTGGAPDYVGHWSESSSTLCPDGGASARHTMCPVVATGTTNMRTPATHDVDTFNAAYP